MPYKCETDCHSEGQLGISYSRVRQDLAWMALDNWLIASSVFFHCSLRLSNLCIALITTQLECLPLLSLTALDCDLLHTQSLIVWAARSHFMNFPLSFWIPNCTLKSIWVKTASTQSCVNIKLWYRSNSDSSVWVYIRVSGNLTNVGSGLVV